MYEIIPRDMENWFSGIIKEVLPNAVKYSGATQVKIIMWEHPAMYQLCVADNEKADSKAKFTFSCDIFGWWIHSESLTFGVKRIVTEKELCKYFTCFTSHLLREDDDRRINNVQNSGLNKKEKRFDYSFYEIWISCNFVTVLKQRRSVANTDEKQGAYLWIYYARCKVWQVHQRLRNFW